MKTGILIVEDEAIVACDIHQQLKSMGYEPVGHATRAEQAIALTAQLRPDLVLMDIQLADGTDGIAAAMAIREQFNVPIVFLTAFAADDTIARASLSEPFGFVIKPFSERELRTVLEMALYKHKAETRLRESVAHTQAVVDNIVDGVITIDQQGVIQTFNKAATAMFGYSPDEANGQSVALLMPEPHRSQHSGYLSHFAKTGEAKIIGTPRDLEGRRKDGSLFPMNLSVSQVLRGGRVTYVGITRDITAAKRAEQANLDNTRQLQALSRRVLEAQETERRRVAIELHDELGQSLTAIKINLQARHRFPDQTAAQTDAENLRIIEDTLKQVRRLALALRPSMLDDLGLAPALKWMAEQTSGRTGFVVEFRAERLGVRLAPEIETACFRIVQEALTNISRHAGATQVAISLYPEGDFLMLSVKDNGAGYDPVKTMDLALGGGSMGVLGMQERAALIGGELIIESGPEGGCAVSLRCPLRARVDTP